MNKLLVTIFLSFLATVAHADPCMDAMRDRNMAISMRNYEMMIQTADAVIQRCNYSVGRAYARTIAYKVLANAQLGRYAEGLRNADICTKHYPGYPTCLYWKAVIHRDLNQRAEYDRTKKVAIESCNYFLQNRSSILAGTQNPGDRIDMEGDIKVAELMLQNLNALNY
jgi:hypothetical protein